MRNTLTENLLGSALTKVLWLTGSLLISLRLSSQAFAAESDTTEIEEVVVTGSYLKRTAADSPSPLSVIGTAQIEDLGAADIAEVVARLAPPRFRARGPTAGALST